MIRLDSLILPPAAAAMSRYHHHRRPYRVYARHVLEASKAANIRRKCISLRNPKKSSAENGIKRKTCTRFRWENLSFWRKREKSYFFDRENFESALPSLGWLLLVKSPFSRESSFGTNPQYTNWAFRSWIHVCFTYYLCAYLYVP